MRRPAAAFLALFCLPLLATTTGAGATAAAAARATVQPEPPQSTRPTPGRLAGPLAPARAWILVDDDTGAVLDAGNDHEALPPASVTKVLTALIAVERLPADAQIQVSPRAASMPALRIDMRPGQVWNLNDALHALLMVSANDAAVALAEQVSGSLDAFTADMAMTAANLHMDDQPVLHDPAGLDDQYAFDGGNRISANDLAIATRAALELPAIRAIVTTSYYPFTGPDGRARHMRNHNLLLTSYPGAIGVKTGYTRRAGDSLIAAASRGGRTMLAVLLGAPDRYHTAAALLDRGFATPVFAESALRHLPPVVPDAARTPAGNGAADHTAGDRSGREGDRGGAASPGGTPVTAVNYHQAAARPVLHLGPWTILVLVAGVALPGLVLFRRRAVRRRRDQRRVRRRLERPAALEPPVALLPDSAEDGSLAGHDPPAWTRPPAWAEPAPAWHEPHATQTDSAPPWPAWDDADPDTWLEAEA